MINTLPHVHGDTPLIRPVEQPKNTRNRSNHTHLRPFSSTPIFNFSVCIGVQIRSGDQPLLCRAYARAQNSYISLCCPFRGFPTLPHLFARGGHSLDPLKSTHAPPQTQLTATQLPTHPALNSSHRHQSNHQSKFWTRGPGPKTFRNSLLYMYPPIILLISSLEKFHITCPSRSMVHLLWRSKCVWE